MQKQCCVNGNVAYVNCVHDFNALFNTHFILLFLGGLCLFFVFTSFRGFIIVLPWHTPRSGVAGLTGKVLACGAVGPGSIPGRARGFCRAYSVLSQDGTLLQWRRELVKCSNTFLSPMQLISSCM